MREKKHIMKMNKQILKFQKQKVSHGNENLVDK